MTERLFDLVRLRQRASRLGLTTLVERDGDILIRPVFGGKLSQQQLRRELGGGIRIAPNQVRVHVDELCVDRYAALNRILDIIVATGASMAVQEDESPSSSSSARMERARSA